MDVLRHDHVGPKIEGVLAPALVDRLDQPLPSTIACEKGLTAEATEGQGVGVARNIVAGASFSDRFGHVASSETNETGRHRPFGTAALRLAVAPKLVSLGASILLVAAGCGFVPAIPLPQEVTDPVPDGFTLVARFAHVTDTQIVDEESPGRLTVGSRFTRSAWRPYEVYSTQLLDGTIRTVNKLHASGTNIDFVIHTGDALDNAQRNELRWFVTAFDGGTIDPRSGPDDREPGDIPEPLLDPHHPFEAQGLYQTSVHGDLPTIDWYSVLGNHDRFAVGVFPIVNQPLGQRTAPLPLEDRIGIFAPLELNPEGSLAWAPITPGNPIPPPRLNLPTTIEPNPDRRYITNDEFIRAHLDSPTTPAGHGFDVERPSQTWYSVSPAPGLRLIGLNSAAPLVELPTLVYAGGAISPPQRRFLDRELAAAEAADEIVVIATHHPSDSLEVGAGTAVTPQALRRSLSGHTNVALHLAGHVHRHAALDRGDYAELITGSIIDAPQQGRIIEIWRNGDEVELRYRFFSHLDEIEPPDDSHADIFDDPLMPMRRVAAELAGVTH